MPSKKSSVKSVVDEEEKEDEVILIFQAGLLLRKNITIAWSLGVGLSQTDSLAVVAYPF